MSDYAFSSGYSLFTHKIIEKLFNRIKKPIYVQVLVDTIRKIIVYSVYPVTCTKS